MNHNIVLFSIYNSKTLWKVLWNQREKLVLVGRRKDEDWGRHHRGCEFWNGIWRMLECTRKRCMEKIFQTVGTALKKKAWSEDKFWEWWTVQCYYSIGFLGWHHGKWRTRWVPEKGLGHPSEGLHLLLLAMHLQKSFGPSSAIRLDGHIPWPSVSRIEPLLFG